MRVLAITAVAGLVLLAGCDNQTDASPPPTTEDALTTATVAPTTPDDADVTSEEPTTVEPTTEEPTTDEPDDDGPPEMPAEAQEQTEAGAEAFALHYIDLVNYTGRNPTLGLLDPLATDECQSCANRVDAVAYGVEHGDHLRQDTFIPGTPTTLLTSNTARVALPVEQIAQDYFRGDQSIDRQLTAEQATLVVRLGWAEGWLISGITVEP